MLLEPHAMYAQLLYSPPHVHSLNGLESHSAFAAFLTLDLCTGLSMARRCHDGAGRHLLSFPGTYHHCLLCRFEPLELEHHC